MQSAEFCLDLFYIQCNTAKSHKLNGEQPSLQLWKCTFWIQVKHPGSDPFYLHTFRKMIQNVCCWWCFYYFILFFLHRGSKMTFYRHVKPAGMSKNMQTSAVIEILDCADTVTSDVSDGCNEIRRSFMQSISLCHGYRRFYPECWQETRSSKNKRNLLWSKNKTLPWQQKLLTKTVVTTGRTKKHHGLLFSSLKMNICTRVSRFIQTTNHTTPRAYD